MQSQFVIRGRVLYSRRVPAMRPSLTVVGAVDMLEVPVPSATESVLSASMTLV